MRRAVALGLLLAATASAQAGFPETAEDVTYVCALYDYGGVVAPGPVLNLSAVETARRGVMYSRVVSRQRQATFVVDYSAGFTPQAQAAFQRAVDVWGEHLTSSVPIRIRADFDALEENVLGQAGPRLARRAGGGPDGTWFPFALADAIGGRDVAPGADDYDIEATFSSSFERFYFGLDGNPAPDQIDFVTVVLHELGHGLGFVGSGDVDDGAEEVECTGVAGIGCVGVEGSDDLVSPLVFDRYLVDASDRDLLDESVYPDNSFALGDLLESEALFMDAPGVVRVYGSRAPVWAPAEFERGSSFSHWDEGVIQESSAALMTPRLAPGEAYQDPGDITCALFEDFGWPLGAGCAELLGAPQEPLTDVLTVERRGPNPFSEETAYRVLLPQEGPMRVTLYDALGRRVGVLFDGPAGLAERVTVQARGLAAGVYRLMIQTPTDETGVAFTVVR